MRSILALAHALPMAAVALLAACSEDPAPVESDGDPVLSGALGEQIMIDPDLIDRNGANGAIALGSQDGSLPAPEAGPQALAAARAAALADVGGPGRMRRAPAAERYEGKLPPGAYLSAAARASAAPGADGDCAALAEYSALWADRLPAPFPVYPHGAVQESAGTDQGGCALRVVNFTTPVPQGEVIDYYYTRARKAGYSAQRVLQDGDDVLGGVKGAASYIAYTRAGPAGGTEVDLVVNGK